MDAPVDTLSAQVLALLDTLSAQILPLGANVLASDHAVLDSAAAIDPLLTIYDAHPVIATRTNLLPLGTLHALSADLLALCPLGGAIDTSCAIGAGTLHALGADLLALGAGGPFHALNALGRAIDTGSALGAGGALDTLGTNLLAFGALSRAIDFLRRLARSLTVGAVALLGSCWSTDRQRRDARGEKHLGHHEISLFATRTAR